MRTVSFQGTQISASERRSQEFRAKVAAAKTASGNAITDLYQAYQGTDWEAVRYWNKVAEFKEYGYVDFSSKGTPFVGDVCGF